MTTPDFPTGIVTLVFTDIQGSSDLWEQYREAFHQALDVHNQILRDTAARWQGVEVKTEGDAFFLVFGTATEAVRFALETQLALSRYEWASLLPGLTTIRVRIGLHSGEPIVAAHPGGAPDYFGPVVNRAARVEAAGHGGQVLVSDAAHSLALANLPPDITFQDLGIHRLKGVGEERLWQLCHPDLPRSFPPLKTSQPERHNLPLPSTPFVGREAEIEQWSALLRQPALRLLTLTGFGGLGKTRLSLQLAELCADEFAHGVWWVELEEARDSEDMAQRIAQQLRLNVEPQSPVREQLVNFLRDRELLLVLDNLEQIPDAGKLISQLLQAAPRVKCLATSRRALRLQMERVVEVSPLPTADAQTLFVERARNRSADFDITPENAADIIELCRRLECVPLAIELAASRTALLTPHEILDRLTERFRLLQTRSPDLPPRQRALQGAIDWSYELLGEEDKALLSQLGVFAGGFTLAAAEAVCDTLDVWEGVEELRNHSLLSTATDDTQHTSFSMLVSVREYALGKLSGSAAEKQVFQRHAEYFLHFIEARVARMRTPGEAQALSELSAELDNLRAALNWARQNGENELCARLALLLYQPLYFHGFWAEAGECLRIGMTAIQPSVGQAPDKHKKLQAEFEYHLASLAHDMGQSADAQVRAQTAHTLYSEIDDSAGTADALNLIGLLATDEGHDEQAQQAFAESLSLRADGDHHGRAIALHNLARLAARRDNAEDAHRLYEESLAQRRAAGDARGESVTLGNLGALAFNTGDYPTARRLYLDSLAISGKLHNRHGIAFMLHNLGELAELEDNFERAVALFTHAERIFKDLPSVHAAAPAAKLASLAENLGADRFNALHRAATETKWEEVVEG